jgi:hypothetical protein
VKKDLLITIIVILSILAVIAGFIGLCFWLFGGKLSTTGLNLSSSEITFLTSNGFLESENANINSSYLKPSNLIEQNLNSDNESFKVLATKLSNNKYQMAFKLENKTEQDKDFYLIPISKDSQLQFEEVRGIIDDKNTIAFNKENTSKEPLEQLYDVEKHKKELNPELAKAYEDIKGNGYSAKPIKITLPPKSTLLAYSDWKVVGRSDPQNWRVGPSNGSAGSAVGLKPVYFLIYGSAGGAKDDLVIINVQSHPQQGENWEVSFTTNGKADLKIIPIDQATIDDDEFVSLFCDNEERTPQILKGDVIYYPNWECMPTQAGLGIGKVIHYTKKAGKHILRFEFNNQTALAYNAVARYWIATSTANWNDTANWSTTEDGSSGASVPVSTDLAYFTDNKDGSCTINATVNVAGISMSAGYGGTISQGSNAVTVGSSNYVQAGGTFTGGDAAITINGTFTQSLGAFTATSNTTQISGNVTISGGTFNHNSGTIAVVAGADTTWDVSTSLTVNNFTVNIGGTYRLSIATNDTIVVNGTTTLTNGIFGYTTSGTLNAKGPISVAATFDGYAAGTSVFLIDGTGDQSFTIPNGTQMPIITLNNSLTTISFAAGATATMEGTFTLQAGTFTASSGTTNFGGNVTISGGTFNHNSGTIAVVAGADTTWDVSTSLTVNNFTVNINGTYRLSIATNDTIVVNGTTTLTNGIFGYGGGDGTLNAKGPISVAATFDGYAAGTSVFLIDGTGDQSFTIPDGAQMPITTLNNSLTTISFGSGATPAVMEGAFTLQAGTFTASSGTTTIAGFLTITGGTFNHNNGTIQITGVSATWDVLTTLNLYNLNVNKTNGYSLTISADDTLIVENSFTHTDGKINPGTVQVQGDVTIGSLADGGTGLIQFTGSNAQTYTDQGGNELDGDITINKSGGSLTLASNADWNTAGQDLTITAGTLNQGASYTVATGAVTVGSSGVWYNSGTGDITLGGNVSNAGIIDLNGGGSGCGTDEIAITGGGSTRTWSGAGTFSIVDVTATNQADSSITAYSSTNGGSSTWTLDSTCSSNTVFKVKKNLHAKGGFKVKSSHAQSVWLTGWSYRKKITIDNAYVDANLTDFPVYVKVNADVQIGDGAQNDGDDIRFTSSNGTTLLKYQEESWSGGAGTDATANYWVKVPTVTTAADTDIYIYYGNASAPDAQDQTNVWDSNFTGVWHLGETGTNPTVYDSTVTGINSTSNATDPTASGKIDGAMVFTGANSDFINLGTGTQYNFVNTTFAVEAWIKASSGAPQIIMANNLANFSADTGGWAMSMGATGDISATTKENNTSANVASFSTTATTFGDNNWHHTVAIFTTSTSTNAANVFSIYVDGALQAGTRTGSAYVYGTPDSSRNYIGRRYSDGSSWLYFNGSIDEVRVSNSARSAEWIKFEYRNINEADNELGWGAQE